MTEEGKLSVRNLITGTWRGLSHLWGHAKTEGLIPQDMPLDEFIEVTRVGREKIPLAQHGNDEMKIRADSAREVANLMKKK